MKNRGLFRFNISLIIVGVFTAASSLQLETSKSEDLLGISLSSWIWLHITICLVCMFGVVYHLYLHWGSVNQWFYEVAKLKSKQTKWLVWLSAITFLSGIISANPFLIGTGHNEIGKIHGKFGLVVIVLTILHIIKRFSWYKNRGNGTAFYPIIDTEKCVSCGKCVKVCPAQIIVKQGKKLVIKNPEFCRQCYKCADACPKQSIKID